MEIEARHGSVLTVRDQSNAAAAGTSAPAGEPTAGFVSILYEFGPAPADVHDRGEPECFGDLNLDQVVATVLAPKQGYELIGYFHSPLDDADAIFYRQQVFADLEHRPVYDLIARFAEGMQTVRQRLEIARKAHYRLQQQRWILDAATGFCRTAEALADELRLAPVRSPGLLGVEQYLAGYLKSPDYRQLRADVQRVRKGLDAVRYNVWIRGARVTVGAFDDEPDYSADILATFERFQQRSGTSAAGKVVVSADMDHVQAQILDRVALVFPAPFAELGEFCRRHAHFVDPIIAGFDREVQFYVAVLDYLRPLRRAGLPVSLPEVSADKAENATQTYDLALASQLVRASNPVVCNDIHLDGSERILVVSGPNNGGKTTMARTVGQLHYLARLGCPVPGREVRLFLVDQIFTHFEREEDIETLAGKLQDELNRLHRDFARATGRSLLIMNEMFSSTTVYDALFLSKQMLTRVSDLDALGVCVTFLDELAELNEKTVSMVSTVDPTDLAVRTYRVVRKPADGRAYAQALANRYGLTYDRLMQRMT